MKNIFKIVLITIIAVLTLVGCGTKTSSLTATITQEDAKVGKYEMKKEIKFTNDAPSSAKVTNNFSSKKIADSYYDLMSTLYANDDNTTVEKSGNKVIINQKKITESYEYYGMSKSSVKETLKNTGWEVK